MLLCLTPFVVWLPVHCNSKPLHGEHDFAWSLQLVMFLGCLPGCNNIQLTIPLVLCRNGSRAPSLQGMRQGSGNGPRGGLGPAQAYTRGIVPRKRYGRLLHGMVNNLKGWGQGHGVWGGIVGWGHADWHCRVGAGLWDGSGGGGSVLWNGVIE